MPAIGAIIWLTTAALWLGVRVWLHQGGFPPLWSFLAFGFLSLLAVWLRWVHARRTQAQQPTVLGLFAVTLALCLAIAFAVGVIGFLVEWLLRRGSSGWPVAAAWGAWHGLAVFAGNFSAFPRLRTTNPEPPTPPAASA